MKYSKRKLSHEIFKINDLIVLGVVFWVSTYSYESIFSFENFEEIVGMRISLRNIFLILIVLLSWHVVFKKVGAYDYRRIVSFYSEGKVILKGTFLCAAVMTFFAYFGHITIINPVVLYRFLALGIIIMALSRIFYFTLFINPRSKSRNKRNVLIAGTGRRALRQANNILRNPYGYNLVGFVDDKAVKRPEEVEELEVVCDFNNFAGYLRENVIDEILICLPIKTFYETISELISIAEEQGIIVRLFTENFDLKLSNSNIDYFNMEPVMTLYTGVVNNPDMIIKKMIDFTGAAILLMVSSPIFIITSILIKLTSKGPVFFLQNRLGMNKRIFKVIKFRTMCIDAEEKLKEIEHLNDRKGEAAFKVKNDPRVTSLGRVLRKLSIDEFPQLINVLKGEMSLVGPRPLPIRDYKGFDKDWHRRRFSVKPGITCIWQVSGRDNVPFERWMQMDMEYIDRWSLWVDIKILLLTIPTLFFNKNAS